VEGDINSCGATLWQRVGIGMKTLTLNDLCVDIHLSPYLDQPVSVVTQAEHLSILFSVPETLNRRTEIQIFDAVDILHFQSVILHSSSSLSLPIFMYVHGCVNMCIC